MKLFGTDGVRGEANTVLTAELAYQLGRAAAFVLKRDGLPDKEPAFVIGKDTRISGDMLEASLIAGICSTGVNVYQAGVIPTPAVAVLTRMLNCMAGVVISASHNPYQDNGIKFFSPLGTKLPDEMEAAIEEVIAADLAGIPTPSGAAVGRVIIYPEGAERYSSFIKGKVDGDLPVCGLWQTAPTALPAILRRDCCGNWVLMLPSSAISPMASISMIVAALPICSSCRVRLLRSRLIWALPMMVMQTVCWP